MAIKKKDMKTKKTMKAKPKKAVTAMKAKPKKAMTAMKAKPRKAQISVTQGGVFRCNKCLVCTKVNKMSDLNVHTTGKTSYVMICQQCEA